MILKLFGLLLPKDFLIICLCNHLTKSVPDDGYSTLAVREKTNIYINVFMNYHWIDTSAGRQLVPDGIIHPVVSATEQTTWSIRNNHA